MLLNFHSPSCAYNHIYNLRKKSVSLLQSIFTSLVHPYLSTKSSLLSPLTLPSTIPQQFFTSLFLRTTIPTIYTKSISLIQPFIQFRLRQGTDIVLISPFFLIVWTVITGLMITDSLSLRLRQKIGVLYVAVSDGDFMQPEWQIIQSTFSHTLNQLPILPYPTNTIARNYITLKSSCVTTHLTTLA